MCITKESLPTLPDYLRFSSIQAESPVLCMGLQIFQIQRNVNKVHVHFSHKFLQIFGILVGKLFLSKFDFE